MIYLKPFYCVQVIYFLAFLKIMLAANYSLKKIISSGFRLKLSSKVDMTLNQIIYIEVDQIISNAVKYSMKSYHII